MKRTPLLFVFLLLPACSKTAEIPAQNAIATPVASASPPSSSASTPVTKTAPRLVQLRTLHAEASFDGDRVATKDGLFDPETLALLSPRRDAKIESAPTPSMADVAVTQVRGNHRVTETESEGAVVENLATGRKILQVGGCDAGGGWSWSLTNRFLVCDSSRSGIAVWDLDARPAHIDVQVWLGEGVTISPNDAYAVAAPVLSWGCLQPTHRGITYFDFASHQKKVVLKATVRDSDIGLAARPFHVAMDVNGDVFAATGDSEIAVFSGKDGSKIASAPAMRGGLVTLSASSKYLLQTRGSYSTVYRLDL